MISIAFPDFLGPVNTKVYSDNVATKSNMKLILNTELNSLFGDPGYGCGLKQHLFEQNSTILHDLIVDKIYNAIRTYIPQVLCKRTDISLKHNKSDIFISITALNLIDYTINNYTISLMDFI